MRGLFEIAGLGNEQETPTGKEKSSKFPPIFYLITPV
jgi:hypothetical protein